MDTQVLIQRSDLWDPDVQKTVRLWRWYYHCIQDQRNTGLNMSKVSETVLFATGHACQNAYLMVNLQQGVGWAVGM